MKLRVFVGRSVRDFIGAMRDPAQRAVILRGVWRSMWPMLVYLLCSAVAGSLGADALPPAARWLLASGALAVVLAHQMEHGRAVAAERDAAEARRDALEAAESGLFLSCVVVTARDAMLAADRTGDAALFDAVLVLDATVAARVLTDPRASADVRATADRAYRLAAARHQPPAPAVVAPPSTGGDA